MALRSDPRRLPRRNHYQEGPGFLFVATQGGRPPEATARSREAGVVRRRRRALRRWADGEPGGARDRPHAGRRAHDAGRVELAEHDGDPLVELRDLGGQGQRETGLDGDVLGEVRVVQFAGPECVRLDGCCQELVGLGLAPRPS